MTVTAEQIRALRPEWTSADVAVTHLYAGYESSNSVWLVQGRDQAAVVRVCIRSDHPENSFWQGMELLFGTNPRRELISYPVSEYPQRLADTLQELARRWGAHDADVQEALPDMLSRARQLPTPEAIAWIMPDLSPTQFLVDGDDIAGLVDIESYVRGPIELELTALEFRLQHVDAFRQGYEQHRELPSIAHCRDVYRFLIFVMYHAPPPSYPKWRDAPKLLDRGSLPLPVGDSL